MRIKIQKHAFSKIIAAITIAAITGILPSIAFCAESATTISVQVKEAELRGTPKFWGTPIASLSYGQSLTVLGTEAGWIKVKTAAGKQGYVHPSAVTEKKIILSANSATSARADKADLVIAGKGFSHGVESSYAAKNPSLNFAAVNHMEREKVSDAELLFFLKHGELGKGAL